MRPLIRLGAGCLGIALAAGPVARAGDGPPGPTWCAKCRKSFAGPHGHPGPGYGTLGYGPPGLVPGFQGFGLGYHRGYGYGGDALGVGVEGGFPFYGGPGYPHPAPALRRVGGINPFPYDGGPGGPTPGCPNYYGATGPLAPDAPAIDLVGGTPPGDYGGFTGIVTDPEARFAPSTVEAATYGPPGGEVGRPAAPPAVAPPASSPVPGGSASRRPLGLDAGPIVEAGGARGLKVSVVDPGGAAERAGLRDGDVIRSANGYVTARPADLAWILANAAPDRALRMRVRSASDGRDRTVTARPDDPGRAPTDAEGRRDARGAVK